MICGSGGSKSTVTTFKNVEGGPDYEAPEVVWNTSSIRMFTWLGPFRIFKCRFKHSWTISKEMFSLPGMLNFVEKTYSRWFATIVLQAGVAWQFKSLYGIVHVALNSEETSQLNGMREFKRLNWIWHATVTDFILAGHKERIAEAPCHAHWPSRLIQLKILWVWYVHNQPQTSWGPRPLSSHNFEIGNQGFELSIRYIHDIFNS
jgi:hypothetical protein